MNLTSAQKLTLRTHILNNATVLPFSGGPTSISTVFSAPSLLTQDAILIKDHYNEATTFRVYRTRVQQPEIMLNGFDWTRVDNLSIGKSRIWEWMFDNPDNAINPSKANIRAGINAVWVGTAADLAVRAAVYNHCHRAATRAEQVLVASGSGTAPDATGDGPGLATAEGELSADEIGDIHGLTP